jgi:hypothetical protein
MKRPALTAVLIAVLLIAALIAVTDSATASGKQRICWQIKLAFANYPSQTSLAYWKLTQRGHIYAFGDFSFRGDHRRTFTRCVSEINPRLVVRVGLRVWLSSTCSKCEQTAQIRRAH